MKHKVACYYRRLTIPKKGSIVKIPMTNDVTESAAFDQTKLLLDLALRFER